MARLPSVRPNAITEQNTEDMVRLQNGLRHSLRVPRVTLGVFLDLSIWHASLRLSGIHLSAIYELEKIRSGALNLMRRKPKPFCALKLILLFIASLSATPAQAGDWGINVYGISYHWDRDLAEQNGWDNEFNPGLGFRYHTGTWLKADAFIDAGAYYDSGRNTAVYAAAGLLWPVDRDKRFNLGVALTAFHSDTYNEGEPFIAPIPLFSMHLEKVVVNLAHFPKLRDLNEIHITAMFLTFPLR